MQASPLPTPGEIEEVVSIPEDQIPADPAPEDELDVDGDFNKFYDSLKRRLRTPLS